MHAFGRLALAALLVVLFASPCLARVATIEATAPLLDQSEQSVKAALAEAVETAVHRAIAMGFSWVAISKALVLEDMVSVQILASDTDPDGEGEAEPAAGGAPGPGPDPAAKLPV